MGDRDLIRRACCFLRCRLPPRLTLSGCCGSAPAHQRRTPKFTWSNLPHLHHIHGEMEPDLPPTSFPPRGVGFPQKPQKEGPASLPCGSPPEIHRVGVLLESFLLQILAHLSFSELPHLPPPGPFPNVPSKCAARRFHPPPHPRAAGICCSGYLQQHAAPAAPPPRVCG